MADPQAQRHGHDNIHIGLVSATGGFSFRLAEDAEGEHYLSRLEPLRPPNAATIQGGGQDFQIRPDVLHWRLSDWSGGEGQEVFDNQNPNRSYRLNSVDPFRRAGQLTPGPFLALTDHDGVSGTFEEVALLVSVGGTLYAFDQQDDDYYTWDEANEEWDGPTTITNPNAGAVALCADGEKIFWLTSEGGTATLWSMDAGGTTATQLENTVIGLSTSMGIQGNNVYLGTDPHTDPPGQDIYEADKAGAGTPIVIDTASVTAVTSVVVPLNGLVYVMVSNRYTTEIREIVPTSAAGVGFGRQLALIEGFGAHSMWAHKGTLYLSGQFGLSGDGTIMYVDPTANLGTLGTLRVEDISDEDLTGLGRSANTNSRLLEHFFVKARRSDTEDEPSLWIVDSISGGIANYAYPDSMGGFTGNQIRSIALHEREGFFNVTNDAGDEGRILRAASGTFASDFSVISPWHDFNLGSVKLLSSALLTFESLPADWTLYLDYAVNGSTTFTNIITVSTAGETTGVFQAETADITMDDPTISFNDIQFRIRGEFTGTAPATTKPVIRALDAFSQVPSTQRVWELLLDVASAVELHSPHGIHRVIAVTEFLMQETGVVVLFDGYWSSNQRLAGVPQYMVLVDSVELNLTRAGEGIARIVLREVVNAEDTTSEVT